jgi:hypothetical protein
LWVNAFARRPIDDLLALSAELEALVGRWPLIEEKTDLFHWAEALNRCDEALEAVLKRRIPTGKLQQEPWDEGERSFVIWALEFAKFLLDSCSSRNIFNSYEVRAEGQRF